MRALQVDPSDNVAVAVQAIPAGSPVEIRDGLTITAAEPVPIGHKLALCGIAAGDMVIKYGVPIGRASRAIAQGSHVHTQNVEDITTRLCQEYAAVYRREAEA